MVTTSSNYIQQFEKDISDELIECPICNHKVSGVITTRVYSRKGIFVCLDCYHKIQIYKAKPYSKLMTKVAILETGYRCNVKEASFRKYFLNIYKEAR